MRVTPRTCCDISTSVHQIYELHMCAISNRIRERPNWWDEVKDKAVTEKRKKELLQQEKGNDPRYRNTKMVKPRYLRITPPVPYFDP